MKRRAIARLMRLTMSEPLGRMLRDIPVQVREQMKTECVYFGEGNISGFERPDVTIRVFLAEGGRLRASLMSRKSGVEHAGPFGTQEEQDAFAQKATQAIHMSMN